MPASKKKRLLVTSSTWPLFNGDHRAPFVRNLVLDLQAIGWECRVIVPHAPNVGYQESDDGIDVHRFRYAPDRYENLAYGAGGLVNLRTHSNKITAAALVAAESAAVLRHTVAFKPDIIHAHWLLPQAFASIPAATLTNTPLIGTAHGSDVLAMNARVYAPFKRAAARACDVITVNGPATRNAVRKLGVNETKISTIYMPPAYENTPSPEKIRAERDKYPYGSFIVTFVGRLIEEKGPDDFIKAIAIAGDDRLHGVIIGTGPMQTSLQKFALDLGVADRIHFLGWKRPDEVSTILAASDAFLGPSKKSKQGGVEAQGIVFLEAMRAKLYVFAARSGGIPGIVRPNETGWLFNESDSYAMAKLIRQAIAGELSKDVPLQGHAFATSVTTRANTAALFDNLFNSVLERRERAGFGRRTGK